MDIDQITTDIQDLSFGEEETEIVLWMDDDLDDEGICMDDEEDDDDTFFGQADTFHQ